MDKRCFRCNNLGHIAKDCRYQKITVSLQNAVDTCDDAVFIEGHTEIGLTFVIIYGRPAIRVEVRKHKKTITTRIVRTPLWSSDKMVQYYITEGKYDISIKFMKKVGIESSITRVTKDNKCIFKKKFDSGVINADS